MSAIKYTRVRARFFAAVWGGSEMCKSSVEGWRIIDPRLPKNERGWFVFVLNCSWPDNKRLWHLTDGHSGWCVGKGRTIDKTIDEFLDFELRQATWRKQSAKQPPVETLPATQ